MFLEILLVICGLGAFLYAFNKLFIAGGVCHSKNRLDGKIAIITGGNTGIGYETGLDFAKRGARVILACRDIKKAERATNEIIQISGNNKIECEKLDLADLESVREFAKKMNSTLNRLDLLVNNAGIMMCPYWKTKDGFEMQLGTNHLGHFLLTNLVLDLMKKTTGNCRIVNVSSLAHTFALNGMNWDDLNSEKSYNSVQAYGQSKLANILFTNELVLRLGQNSNISVYSLHPGSIRTELTRNLGEGVFFLIPYIIQMLGPILICWFLKTPSEGAQTTIYCSVSDEAYENKGLYFSDCKTKTTSKAARNVEAAKKLWEVSEKLVGLN